MARPSDSFIAVILSCENEHRKKQKHLFKAATEVLEQPVVLKKILRFYF